MDKPRLSEKTRRELIEGLNQNKSDEEIAVFDDPIMGWWSNAWVNWDDGKKIEHKPNSKGKG